MTNTLGKYELLEKLGEGGFGTVYRAREISLDVIRAVKILHPNLVNSPEFIQRFRREGRITARLDHPHIVPIYELGEEQGYYYLSMKYLPGGSLKDWLTQHGRLSFEQSITITRQVADALDYAQNEPEKLIHRDLKPGNILFERLPDDPKGLSIRLSDFGFAKALASADSNSLSASGGLLGTPAYIAPEIWDDQPASPASDQYSLACVLYEMLTGQMLFTGSTPIALMKNVAAGPKFPETWPPGVPADVSGVLRRALAGLPEERYATAFTFSANIAKLPLNSQKAELERNAQTEAAERAAREQAEKERAEVESREKAAREKAEREITEKVTREQANPEDARDEESHKNPEKIRVADEATKLTGWGKIFWIAIVWAIISSIRIPIDYPLGDVLSGVVTGIILLRQDIASKGYSITHVAKTWLISWAIGAAIGWVLSTNISSLLSAIIQYETGSRVGWTVGSMVIGLVYGLVTGLLLYKEGMFARVTSILQIAFGWAIGWGICYQLVWSPLRSDLIVWSITGAISGFITIWPIRAEQKQSTLIKKTSS